MSGPKTLILDIENTPTRAYVWALFNQNVSLNQINSDWYMLCWAAKWLGDDYVYSDALVNYGPQYKADPRNDYNILLSIRDMMDEADIVVGHNSQAFDVPKINARLILNGIEPPSSFQQIDTYRIAKQSFKFTSNKLEYIATALGLGGKSETGGFDLWDRCMDGDLDAWEQMVEYNEQDVLLTEEVYLKLRPWARVHPNFALYVDDTGDELLCNRCGKPGLTKRGYAHTNLGKFHEYHCKSCGSRPRGRKNVANRDVLVTNAI